ncbi:MAG: hypothetical protein R3E66_13260 [bacterium]
MDLTYKIVRRLLRDREVDFSRNRNFEAYEDPNVKRALRIARHLQSVERDLLAADGEDVTLQAVEQDDAQVVVRLAYRSGNGRRVSFLTPQEWQLLLESERIRAVLERLLDAAPMETQNKIPRDALAMDE